MSTINISIVSSSEEIYSGEGTMVFATGSPGKYVKLEDTIKSFKGILAGDYDDLPEQAFYMVGTIEEAVEKAKNL